MSMMHSYCQKMHISFLIPDGKEEDPFQLASDLSDMLHDVGVLNRIAHLTSTLKCSYQVLFGFCISSLLGLYFVFDC